MPMVVLVLAERHQVLHADRFAMAAHRQDDGLVAAAVAVQVEMHRRRAFAELQRRRGARVGEDRIVDTGAAVADQHKTLLHPAGGNQRTQQVEGERIGRATQVDVEGHGGMRQPQAVLEDDRGSRR
ncbi:hypothetical protein MM817_03299 [Acidibacillus sp. S0AB]|uniref:Uncharacterized protein n=1 Tax=Sulfoacidibacillus ferrooxidans TaxID=2005001 RepID=A0A9X1VCS9_9BACL|nr:hypothetical protein [Sulfoacidibacillus ferrooxidans]